nr:unnamed protein product [Spirometra erinaceieuropaei]
MQFFLSLNKASGKLCEAFKRDLFRSEWVKDISPMQMESDIEAAPMSFPTGLHTTPNPTPTMSISLCEASNTEAGACEGGGIPGEIYKSFVDTLAPCLYDVIEQE